MTASRVLAVVDEVRHEAVDALVARAGLAEDLDPSFAADLPGADDWRGLEAFAVHLRARREVLFTRFLTSWRELEREGSEARLRFAIRERPDAEAVA